MEKFLLGVLAGITGVTLTALIVDKLDGVNCGIYFKCPAEVSSSENKASENEESESDLESAGTKEEKNA